MSELKDYVIQKPRQLPVIVLADVSGSMSKDGKIETLNAAISEMINKFAEEDNAKAEIQVAVITFGDSIARIHSLLKPAKEMKWENMSSRGNTPMGASFVLAKRILEDKDKISSRSYIPTIVLVSDGLPNDDWEKHLEDLLKSERAKKAVKLAMGIGSDADLEMLAKFVDNKDIQVFCAGDAREIAKFFRWVTYSVTKRVRSINPDIVENVSSQDIENI